MNQGPENTLRFSDILASSVHDMKNSIAMLLNTIDEAIDECSIDSSPGLRRLSDAQYEARRANNGLIQLLTLYKIHNAQFIANISHHSVHEFLEEMLITSERLLHARGIHADMDCPSDLYWFFDQDLVAGVINNVINNAFRYARKRIRLVAHEWQDFLVLGVEDDGTGYPPDMVSGPGLGTEKTSVSFRTGSTGLGFFFSATVARLHTKNRRQGYIDVENGGTLGGGCFRMMLP